MLRIDPRFHDGHLRAFEHPPRADLGQQHYTLEREQNKQAAISVGVRPAARKSNMWGPAGSRTALRSAKRRNWR